MKRHTSAALAALCLMASTIAITTAATAHDYTVGTLQIHHPMAYETPRTAMAGGGYLTITNTGETPDRLTGVRADFPRVMIHDTEVKDGVASMFHVEGVDIPPGATVALQPGGLHIMFMGLNGDPLEQGETFPATLIFEHAGEVEVIFNVEERGAGPGHTGH